MAVQLKRLWHTLKIISMAGRNKVIGGEFDVDIQSLQYKQIGNEQLEGVYKYSTGRSALYYILLDVKAKYDITRVMLPDYLCSSVVIAAEKAEIQVEFYELNDKLELEENIFADLYDSNSAVLIINYFGLQNIACQVAYVRSLNKDAIIIEDDVQAYYEFLNELNDVDYKFTSFRKSFACPDGRLVKTNSNLPIVGESNKFHQYKLAGSILKSLRKPDYYDDEVYLHLFEKGESLIDDEIQLGISNMALEIMSKTDTDRLAYIRRRNANFIVNGLVNLGIKIILPITEENTPLFVPIYLENRNKVRKYMFQHNVFCPVHWPLEGMNVKTGAEMAEHELSIIVDQRYTNADMEYILELIEKSIK